STLDAALGAGLQLGDRTVASGDTLVTKDLSQLTARQIDAQCPVPSFNTNQNGVWVQYALPKSITIGSTFENVVYGAVSTIQVADGSRGTRPLWSAGDDVVVQSDGLDPHRLFLGFAIACGNLAVRPIFMAPVVDGQAWNDLPIRTYEND